MAQSNKNAQKRESRAERRAAEAAAIKARAEQALHDVKTRVSHASDNYYYRAKKAVYRADDYVHEKPWQGIGVGAAVGLVLGLLLARR